MSTLGKIAVVEPLLVRVRRMVLRTVAVAVTATATLEWTTGLPSQGRSSNVYRDWVDAQITPLLRTWLEPESTYNEYVVLCCVVCLQWLTKHAGSVP